MSLDAPRHTPTSPDLNPAPDGYATAGNPILAPRVHSIAIRPAYRKSGGGWSGHGLSIASYRGADVLESRSPIFDCARHLLNAGVAQPGDTIEMERDGVVVMRANVAIAARLTVSDPDRGGGPKMVKWIPFDRGERFTRAPA